MLTRFLIWWCSVLPKAKWLIVTTTIYAVIALASLAMGMFDVLTLIQIVWIAITSLPLWFKPLADWLDMKRPSN
jgi:uncharacterized membrane protein